MDSKEKMRIQQEKFILESAFGREEITLDLYRLICKLYYEWDKNHVVRVEPSIKINNLGINYERYSIPIPLDIKPKHAEIILIEMGMPEDLVEILKLRYFNDLRMFVGADYKNNIKKIYFYDHKCKNMVCIEFGNKASYNYKIYNLVDPLNYGMAKENLKSLIDNNEILTLILEVVPFSDWFCVYDKMNYKVNKEMITGYHISIGNPPEIRDVLNYLTQIAEKLQGCSIDIKMRTWLEYNSYSKLYWLSIGRNSKNYLETTFYVRPSNCYD